MFSISMGFRMIDPFTRPGFRRIKDELQPVSLFILHPSESQGLILSRDLRGEGDDVPVAVSHQEIAVGDLDRSGVHADEDIHPVVILPQRSDLYAVQVVWLAQGVYYVLADYGIPPLAVLFLLIRVLLTLLFRWHLFSGP